MPAPARSASGRGDFLETAVSRAARRPARPWGARTACRVGHGAGEASPPGLPYPSHLGPTAPLHNRTYASHLTRAAGCSTQATIQHSLLCHRSHHHSIIIVIPAHPFEGFVPDGIPAHMPPCRPLIIISQRDVSDQESVCPCCCHRCCHCRCHRSCHRCCHWPTAAATGPLLSASVAPHIRDVGRGLWRRDQHDVLRDQHARKLLVI